mmetsp:Transcript_48700/g.152869  ORF Transcript_48700/g.152869 Transcript_48700/m.152869 type:complete len:712 (-) Transcript_48700:494-2629(-)
MSSLASSPPKGGGSQSLQNWARMQSYSEAQIRQQMLENSLTGTMQQMDRYPPEMNGRRLAMEEMGIAHGNGLNYPYGMDIGSSLSYRMMQGGYPGEGKYMPRSAPFMPGQYPPQMPPGYMARERDFHPMDDQFHDFGDMTLQGLPKGARDLPSRMNDVRLAQAQMAQMDFRHRPGDATDIRLMPNQSEMMRADQGPMKMHTPFAGMYANLSGHPGVPYVTSQAAWMHGGFGALAGRFDLPQRTSSLQAAKHNKYCHFCQHVKVRASGMLACCNKDCTRRFCEHCLSKSIGDDVNPQTSNAWINGQWHCPVCRKLCCCAIGECDKNHRHCKAYRYRVRRAEQQANKRAVTGADSPESPNDDDRDMEAEDPVKVEVETETKATSRASNKDIVATPPQQVQAPPVSAEPIKLESSGSETKVDEPMLLKARRAHDEKAEGSTTPQSFDFNDVQTVADSWLKLLEDDDAEDVSFLFSGENGYRHREGLPTNAEDVSLSREDSREGFEDLARMGKDSVPLSARSARELMLRHENSDSLNSLLANSQGLDQNMHHTSSTESFGSMMAATTLPRNVSNESLGGMMPRAYSSSSLDAVLESNEGWPGEEEGAPESTSNGNLGVDFDFLNRSSNAPPTPHNWTATPRAMAMEGSGDLAFLSRGIPESMGTMHAGQPTIEQVRRRYEREISRFADACCPCVSCCDVASLLFRGSSHAGRGME